MDIEIRNCNNIDYACIKIEEKKLNIKYGINGTGKTTIAKSIEYSVHEDKQKLIDELIPFKNRNDGVEGGYPAVDGIQNIKKVLVFNEEYINNYVFLEDEILKNSFEVFIKNKDFDEVMKEIESLTQDIRELFKDDFELNNLVNDLTELSLCFGKSKKGYSASSSLGKGLKNGNKIANIPEELKSYEDYLNNENNVKWLKWQISGKDYIDISCKCPYCSSEISSKKKNILKVSEEYNSKVIEHLNKVLDVFNKLSGYFTDDTNNKISEITHSINGISNEEKQYLISIKNQVDIFLKKLNLLKELDYFTLKDVGKIIEELKKYKINIKFLTHLDTESTREKIESINESLDKIIEKAGILQGKINIQNNIILKNIEGYTQEINNFLRYAGYKYRVDIEFKDEEYKMLLHHENIENSIENGKMHLSYGEKNAFALILFMYEAISKSPDLIILDDPISSFDKNKKFAIINKLFKGEHSLKNSTILMLTHDFDPIVDMILNFKHIFNEISPSAYFLENKNGTISEKIIGKDDIKTFIEIAKENIKTLDNNLNKLIYLRRLYEINDSKGIEWNLLSNLFHKRKKPQIRKMINNNEKVVDMTQEEIERATHSIRNFISDFDYYNELDKVLNNDTLIKCYENSNNNYEKLQIYRIINNDNSSNSVVKKFVNKTFHIDNDYLFQLNPCKYEVIPQYIIDECDKDLEEIMQIKLINNI